MSKKSDQVKEWRRRTKKRLIKAFDNECCVCKGNFDPVIYDFHHVNEEKESKISDISRASIRSWGKIVNEVRKCVMVCSNCHRLIHAGIKQVPHDAKRFNEKYTCYDPIVYPKIKTKSGKKVYYLLIQKYTEKSKRLINKKPPRNLLKTLLKKNSITSLSHIFDVSRTTIRRWAKGYGIIR